MKTQSCLNILLLTVGGTSAWTLGSSTTSSSGTSHQKVAIAEETRQNNPWTNAAVAAAFAVATMTTPIAVNADAMIMSLQGECY